MLRQEEREEEEEKEGEEEEEIKDKTNQNNNNNNNNNNYNNEYDFDYSNIFSSASLWLTGGNRPTLYLPIELAKKYRMDKPCRVAFFTHKDGILISFVCRNESPS
jgi:hypothetical protein